MLNLNICQNMCYMLYVIQYAHTFAMKCLVWISVQYTVLLWYTVLQNLWASISGPRRSLSRKSNYPICLYRPRECLALSLQWLAGSLLDRSHVGPSVCLTLPISLSHSLSLCMSPTLYHYVTLPASVYVSHSISLCHTPCLGVCLPLSISLSHLSLWHTPYLCVCLPLSISLSHSLSRFMSPTLYLSVTLPISVYVSHSLSLCHTPYLCVYLPLSISLSHSLSLCMSSTLYLSVTLPISVYVAHYTYMSISLSHSLSMSMYPNIYLPITLLVSEYLYCISLCNYLCVSLSLM